MRKIVITGGPGTGKTSIITSLESKGYTCMPEISRQITLEAREQGIDQLFLEDPMLFSNKLLEGRKKQFLETSRLNATAVFLDRGLPDVLAYMDYIGDVYPQEFVETCRIHRYDQVFLLPPWKEIYTEDNERYESFEQATLIYKALKETYLSFNYELIEVPIGKLENRIDFIMNSYHKNE
ncbi:AAA family ATPase [Ascidiimonas sp. W6]|uniref:AAA family ATPase n=1 Tax=Ascidiimonas meishanensis TaxID=3128903 RepID=UPI0030EDA222